MSAERSIGDRVRWLHFAVGERIALTGSALRCGLQGRARSRYGIVRSIDPASLSISVQRDGLRRPDDYSVSWWRHLRATDDGVPPMRRPTAR